MYEKIMVKKTAKQLNESFNHDFIFSPINNFALVFKHARNFYWHKVFLLNLMLIYQS